MCGIAGRFSLNRLDPDPTWSGRVDKLLAHRGMDGQGHFVDEYCELIHRRLAIVDLSPTGHQPLFNEDGNIAIVFNGEIYNHYDLRNDLKQRGHIFKGASDTEVLVHLYEEYGQGMTNLLCGMFAFAIYDLKKRLLFMARDRFGIKPLYYTIFKNQWIFASEIKVLLAIPGFKPTINRQACYDYLGLGYTLEPMTAFTEIKALPRGTSLIVNNGEEKFVKFYSIQARPDSKLNLEDAVESVSENLLRSVSEQTKADVPVAALLSGGIDSALVVAAYCKTAKTSPFTFNLCFSDKDYDESALAKTVSLRYQTQHRSVELRQRTLSFDEVLKLIRHFDQPFADSSLIPEYEICRAIKQQGIVCALSGDGGDETFGGYARFWRANKLIKLMGFPEGFRNSLAILGNSLAGKTLNFGRQLAKAVDLANRGRQNTSILLAGLSNYLNEEEKEALVHPEARYGLRMIYEQFDGFDSPGTSDLDELSRRMTENLFNSLASDMLRKVDMMSMLAGIEIRVPMLDERIVSFGLSLPHRLKTNGRSGKIVLRELAKEWLPEEVASHSKRGFSIPLDSMASDAFQEGLEDLLLSPNSKIKSFLDLNIIRRWIDLFKKARKGRFNGAISRGGLYQRLFILLALEVWLQEQHLSW